MDKSIAISVNNLSKKYEIGKLKENSVVSSISSLLNKKSSYSEEFWALKNLNFEIKKGEVVGIIGKNGAGKSTLLKVLSQITKPTEGRIEINGRIASLLEVGTGFHPELTGRENIFLNGTVLGMTRKEVKEKFDEIVAFSGVEKFIDTPVKNYSSGMYVRLAFAVAAHLDPEILIIDEVLAVGDAEFQKKCLGKMKDVAENGRTVLFVSHNLAVMNSICKKGILISKGELVKSGNIQEVINVYTQHSLSQIQESKIDIGKFHLSLHQNKTYNRSFGVQETRLFCNEEPSDVIYSGSKFTLECDICNEHPIPDPIFGIIIKDNEGNSLIGLHNMITGQTLTESPFQNGTITFEIPFFPFFGSYVCSIDIYYGNKTENFDIIDEAIFFNLEPSDIYKTSKLPEVSLNKVVIKDVNIHLTTLN